MVPPDITNFGWKICNDIPVPVIAGGDPAPLELVEVIRCQCINHRRVSAELRHVAVIKIITPVHHSVIVIQKNAAIHIDNQKSTG